MGSVSQIFSAVNLSVRRVVDCGEKKTYHMSRYGRNPYGGQVPCHRCQYAASATRGPPRNPSLPLLALCRSAASAAQPEPQPSHCPAAEFQVPSPFAPTYRHQAASRLVRALLRSLLRALRSRRSEQAPA